MGDVLDNFWQALDRMLPFIPEPWRQVVGILVPALVIIFALIGLGRWALKPDAAPATSSDRYPPPPTTPPITPPQEFERPLSRDEVLRKVANGVITLDVARGIFDLQKEAAAIAGEEPVAAETREAFVRAAVEIGKEGDAAEREALALLAEGKADEAERRLESDIAQAAGSAIEKLRRKGALFAPTATDVAKDAYERLLALSPGDKDALIELGHLLIRIGDLPAAEASYRAVLDAAGADRGSKALALACLGVAALHGGDPRAEDYLTQALKLYEQLNENEGVAACLGNLGTLMMSRGELAKAADTVGKALVLHQEAGNANGMASNFSTLGLIARTRGHLADARANHLRSLELVEQLGDQEGMATCLGNLGTVCMLDGDLDAAEKYHSRSLAIEERLGRKAGMAADLGNLGLVASRRKDYAAAEDYFQRALTLSNSVGAKELSANQHGNLGNLAAARGAFDDATTHFELALTLNEELGRREGMANTNGALGNMAAVRGDKQAARAHFERALELFIEMGAEDCDGARRARQSLSALDMITKSTT